MCIWQRFSLQFSSIRNIFPPKTRRSFLFLLFQFLMHDLTNYAANQEQKYVYSPPTAHIEELYHVHNKSQSKIDIFPFCIFGEENSKLRENWGKTCDKRQFRKVGEEDSQILCHKHSVDITKSHLSSVNPQRCGFKDEYLHPRIHVHISCEFNFRRILKLILLNVELKFSICHRPTIDFSTHTFIAYIWNIR